MSDNLCDSTVDQFIRHLQSGFKAYHLDNRCLIVTPFLYPDFASIEYSIEPVGSGYLLTDNSETLNMLFANGLTIETNHDLQKQVSQIVKNHGAELTGSEISIIANIDNLGEASHKLLNAVQAIGHVLYKRRSVSFNTFEDEVEKVLITNEVKYDYNYLIQGHANTHKIKFHINSNRNVLIEPVTAATYSSARNKAIKVAYKWLDIRQVNQTLRFVTVIDDRDKKWETVWSDDEAQRTIFTHSNEVIRWTTEQQKLVGMLI
jgi:hypothetical protein